MVFPVVGGTQDTGYEISNSLRFNDDDSPSMTIASLGSSSSNAKKWTVSFWAKLSSGLGGHRCVFSAGEASGGQYVQLNFTDEDRLQIYSSNALGSGGSATNIKTNALYRDVSAWYHVVWAIDTTQGTNTNRIKLYVNGAQETSFETANNYPSQNADNDRVGANNIDHFIGKFVDSSSQYFDGYLSDFYFIDGDAKSYTDFGETNDNGVWIPKKYAGSYGNNGFKLEFKQTGTSANSSGIGADTSGNDNHFSVSNLAAIDVTEDTPTNNFCTMNPIYSYSGITFSEGNLQTNLGGSNHRWGTSTFFVANGKWYFECKLLSDSNYNSGPGVIAYGIDDPITTEGGGAGSKAEGWIYLSTNAGDLQHGGTQYGTASAATTNDILMVAFDVDNGKIWIGKNGTWSEGSNPSTGNGAVREDLGDASSGLFSPGVSGYAENMVFNFGNPPFSISSGNADANGYGNFEYAVPSGFYSLCTKNLAEYG
jgi:hypothetical protein